MAPTVRRSRPSTDPARLVRAVCDEIRYCLYQGNLTQVMLAKHLDVCTAVVSRKMLEKSQWTVAELHRVAMFLGMSVSELVGQAQARAERALDKESNPVIR